VCPVFSAAPTGVGFTGNGRWPHFQALLDVPCAEDTESPQRKDWKASHHRR
jgi:hypothetical protein